MIAILLTVAGAAACYLLARERCHGAGRHRHAGRRRRIGRALVHERVDDPAATVRFAAGAVVAYGWVRASRGRSTRGQWAWATIGVALGLAAALVWKEPLAFSGTLSVPTSCGRPGADCWPRRRRSTSR